MSTQGVITNVELTARFVSAELAHEVSTQQTRKASNYRQEYLDAADKRIAALREADTHLRAALAAVQRWRG